MLPSASRFTSFIACLLFVATFFQPSAAQEQSPFVLRILEINSGGRYTCTALTADRQWEQLTVMTYQGVPAPTELRRGPASDEDMKKAEELLQQPQFRSAASVKPTVPGALIQRDGKFITVLGRVDGTPKIVQFLDTEGKKSMPKYFKGFEAFAEDVRRRKLPKPGGKVTPHCQITIG